MEHTAQVHQLRRQTLASGAHSLICRTAPNLPKMSYISSAEMLNGRLRTYSILQQPRARQSEAPAQAGMHCAASVPATGRRAAGSRHSKNAHLVTSGGSLWLRLRTAAEAIPLECHVRAGSASVCRLPGGVSGRSKRGSSRATWCSQPQHKVLSRRQRALRTAQHNALWFPGPLLICERHTGHSGVPAASSLKPFESDETHEGLCMKRTWGSAVDHCIAHILKQKLLEYSVLITATSISDRVHFGSA